MLFSERQVDVFSWSDTVQAVKVPSDMAEAAYGIRVETGQGISNEVEFKVTREICLVPKITSQEPASGKSGGLAEIFGSDFGNKQGSGRCFSAKTHRGEKMVQHFHHLRSTAQHTPEYVRGHGQDSSRPQQ